MGGAIRLVKISILLFAILLTLACSSGGGDDPAPAPPTPPAFTTADLSGTYRVLGVSTGGINEGFVAGDVIINSSGSITSGSYIHSVGTTVNITSSSLALDAKGILSGTFNTDVGVTTTIQYGKMNASKNFLSFVSSTQSALPEYDQVAVFRAGSSFGQADLGGAWYVCEIYVGVNEQVACGIVNISSTGTVTTAETTGSVTMSSGGIISGSITSTTGTTSSLVGVLDTSKEFAGFVSGSSLGETSFSIGIKEGGSFSLSDLNGTWDFTLASTGAADGTSYGSVQLDAGQVRGGFYKATTGNVTLTGGSLSMATNGTFSGSITAADGTTFSVIIGKMNNSRNMIFVGGISSSTGGQILLIANKES